MNGKIKYFIRDDQYSPAVAQMVVKELVDKHGIFAFTGGVSGAGGHAVKDYLAANKVLWVVPGTAALNTVADRDKNGMPSLYRYCSYPLFEDEASALAYATMHEQRVLTMGASAVQFKLFDVNEPLSRLTRGLV